MEEITLEMLTFAYRKAKVDLYYSVSPREQDLLEYEEHLATNLELLLSRILGDNRTWVTTPEFVGGYSVVPKSLEWTGDEVDGMLWSNPHEELKAEMAGGRTATPKFRVISDCSVDMHVLSSLWIMTVGAKLDEQLSPSAMGNRLRRRITGEFNELSSGSFKPYLGPYKRWREDGLAAIQEALDKGKRVAAITGDATSFYHKLSPNFLDDPNFLRNIAGVKLESYETKVNSLFIESLRAWSASVAEEISDMGEGLPVGLPASAIVANLALLEFDRFIETDIIPLYYARYVDDFFLVLEDAPHFTSQGELWNWVTKRASPSLRLTAEPDGICFAPKYLKGSDVKFTNHKNRIFKLGGRTGKAVISSIRRAVYEQGSEWRSLPQLPDDENDIGTRMVVAVQADGDPADNLRKADKISARRARFALQLRDFEAFDRDLEPAEWKKYREAFFLSACDYVLTPDAFFELWKYLPRLLRLSLRCGDYHMFAMMLASVDRLILDVDLLGTPEVTGAEDAVEFRIIDKWRSHISRIVIDALATSIENPLTVSENRGMQIALTKFADQNVLEWYIGAKLPDLQWRLFVRDLAYTPARFAILPKEIAPRSGPKRQGEDGPDGSLDELSSIDLPETIMRGNAALAKIFPGEGTQKVFHGLSFPTRPLNLIELFIAADPFVPRVADDTKDRMVNVADAVLSLRGFRIYDDLPTLEADGGVNAEIYISDSNRKKSSSRRIAIGSLETHNYQAKRAAKGGPDHGLARYLRVTELANEIISRRGGVDYLVLPELSIPANWFVPIAHKLAGRGISLIAGIEYIRAEAEVHNQVWSALRHSHFGFPSHLVYRQDKQRPAPSEKVALAEWESLYLKPRRTWDTPPVIHHGDFHFAVVVCSELTNIAYRSSLRGRIDALFVPEWNQDIHTFEALVESAALDIHAYVVQVNNRSYGDSRIRVPAAKEWERDLIRHRGGLHDYTVVGEVDLHSLREEQSVHRVQKAKFKPIPDGFEISKERYRLPDIEKR